MGYIVRRQFFSCEPTPPRGEAFAVEEREGPGCEGRHLHTPGDVRIRRGGLTVFATAGRGGTGRRHGVKHGLLRGTLLLSFALCAAAWPWTGAAGSRSAHGAAAAGVTVRPAAPAQRERGYGRRRRRGRVRRVLKAPYKAVKVSGKATGRAVKASGKAVGRTFRRAFGTRRRKRY